MKVWNPNRTPVTVDDGRVVPARAHDDVPAKPRARAAVADGRLIEQPPPAKQTRTPGASSTGKKED